jgi:hypothetical protein
VPQRGDRTSAGFSSIRQFAAGRGTSLAGTTVPQCCRSDAPIAVLSGTKIGIARPIIGIIAVAADLVIEAQQEVEARGNGEDDEGHADPSRRSPAEERRVELPTREEIRTEDDHRSCEEGRARVIVPITAKPGRSFRFPLSIARHEPVLLGAL